MTTRHHRGELLARRGAVARYRYFPDHVEAPEVWGEFQVDLDTWAYEILVRADLPGRETLDEVCVAALVHKMKRGAPSVPERVYFIA